MWQGFPAVLDDYGGHVPLKTPTRRLAYGLVAMLCGIMFMGAGAAFDSGPSFDARAIMAWTAKAFFGETQYDLTEIDGREAVRASCDHSASGKYLYRKIDLTKTPVMEWTWRVDETFSQNIDETARAGDDYPVRIYVMTNARRPWRTRALNYVWSSAKAGPADWPNAYARQTHMIAVRSGPPEKSGQWITERRNIREDFKRYHGIDLTAIDAVAIMTDCDDIGVVAEGWYQDIRFVTE